MKIVMKIYSIALRLSLICSSIVGLLRVATGIRADTGILLQVGLMMS